MTSPSVKNGRGNEQRTVSNTKAFDNWSRSQTKTILKTALVIVVQLYGTAYPLRLNRKAL